LRFLDLVCQRGPLRVGDLGKLDPDVLADILGGRDVEPVVEAVGLLPTLDVAGDGAELLAALVEQPAKLLGPPALVGVAVD
jgi:hypothetical protein